MSERLTLQQTADLLLAQNDIGILMHRFPDGDTIGSAYALCRALRTLGKRVKLLCCDPIPDKYSYLHPGEGADDFEPTWLCAVDTATPTLLGSLQETYGDRIALCIDHHATNTAYADYLLLDDLAANAMNIARLIPLSRQIEGVWGGLTLRQKPSGNYKVSVRTGTEADASAICAVLGGGGHMRAAGCDPEGDREEVLRQLPTAIAEIVPEISY